MEQSRPRLSQKQRNQQFIVQSKRHFLRDLSVILFSSLVWMYVLGVIYFFVDVVIGLNHPIPNLMKSWFRMTNNNVRFFLFSVLIGFVIIYSLLWLWSKYNKRKYGSLRRRTYPKDTQSEDILKLGLMDYDTYHMLQNAKSITLEKNPMK